MRQGESTLGAHMMALGDAADILGMGRLALALELTVGLEQSGDVVDGAFVEFLECCGGG